MTKPQKKFKAWDREFDSGQIARERVFWLGSNWQSQDGLMAWSYAVTVYPQDQVQFAVYNAEDAAKWQLFRVALKGLPTRLKLRMLHNRYNKTILEPLPMYCYEMTGVQRKIEMIRISNYILAIVRSGHLNSRYEVVKDGN